MELPGGIRRITCELPTRPGHVHTYLLPGDDGWTLVDTGLGLPDAAERWAAELAGVPGEVTRIVITHFHPDHVGAAADVAIADRRARPSGNARLRAVLEGLGRRPRLAATHRGLVHQPWCAAAERRRADRVGLRLRAVRPLPAGPGARGRGRPGRRLGARRSAWARGRPALPAEGRDHGLRRPPARPDLTHGRPLAREPAGPARRLPRLAAPDDRARAPSRAARARRADRGSGRTRARADRAPSRAARDRRSSADRHAPQRL